MKRLMFVLLLLSVATVRADDSAAKQTSVNVPDGATMDITAPAGWSLETTQPDPKAPATTELKSPKEEADLQISFIADKDGDFSTKDKLIENVERVAKAQFVDSSVEKAVRVQTLESANGTCVYAEFTVADLVGKDAKPGEYKVTATGLMKFGDTIAIFTLLGPALDDKAYADAKDVLKSGIVVHK